MTTKQDLNSEIVKLQSDLVGVADNRNGISQEQVDQIDAILTAGSHWIAAQDALERAITAEGTPQVKDAFDGYKRAVEESLELTMKAQNKVLDDLHEAQELARKHGFGVES